MKKIYETIIVGAGPAGLMAGRYLEDALILDQKKEIGKPVQCAEGLAKKFLDHFGIKADPNWISATIDTTQIILPNGKVINLKGESYVLDRINFEKFLASQCLAKILLQKRVVEIERERDLWQVKTENGEIFKSKYLIGADGPLSIVRRKVFPEEKVAIYPCLEYLVKLEKEVDCSKMKIYLDQERLPLGYAWIFPKGKNLANIGLGSEKKKKNLNQLFKDFLENTVKKELGNYQLLKNLSGLAPWQKKPIKLIKDNVLLVGDAGAMVDPISGGGIGNAMIAGEQAAKSILEKDILSYPERIKFLSCFNKDLFSAQKIIYSLDNPTLNEIGEILEKKGGDIFYLKKFSALSEFLSKPNLRRNIFKFLKIFFIYKKWTKSQTII